LLTPNASLATGSDLENLSVTSQSVRFRSVVARNLMTLPELETNLRVPVISDMLRRFWKELENRLEFHHTPPGSTVDISER